VRKGKPGEHILKKRRANNEGNEEEIVLSSISSLYYGKSTLKLM
jgi:hypothetical protein